MIELRGVGKSYHGRRVLEGVDWTVRPGGAYLVAGPSGAGKTTLLRLLMGLETPDSGAVNGTARFCPLFQEDRLIEHWNAVQNVSLVCGDRERARAVLRAMLPDDALRQPVRTLSGGMRRRAALARALAAPGEVLVLDEPFVGLDAAAARAARDAVLRYRDGRAVAAVSHGHEALFSEFEVLRLTL